MIAGCGTLLPTRSIQPRKPPAVPVCLGRRGAHRPAPCGDRRTRWPARSSSFAPKPLAPLLRQVRTAGCCAVPAMSTCAHGMPSTNSSRNSAAVMEPGVDAAHVGHVGDRGVQLRAVGPVQRELPDRLVGGRPGRLELVDEAGVVAHHPGDVDAEGAQARPGQGGDVDDGVDAVLDGEAQPVGHHQAPLGVGVEHLDGRAVAHPSARRRASSPSPTACCRCSTGTP